MTQEEKQLLLRDLCGRLPYGVKFQGEDSNVYTLDAANYFALQVENVVYKPYLRPMSSMAEEEKKELKSATCPKGAGYFDEQYLICPMSHFGEYISYDFMSDILNWLNAYHFDYRGLIEKGLALEAPEGMYDNH